MRNRYNPVVSPFLEEPVKIEEVESVANEYGISLNKLKKNLDISFIEALELFQFSECKLRSQKIQEKEEEAKKFQEEFESKRNIHFAPLADKD